MGWNGLDLVNDFSAELGDISSGFKTRVLRWINDGVKDIATSHQWPFLREKGQVLLLENQSVVALPLSQPTAPTVALQSGGSLALVTEYKVLITFYEGFSGVESVAGIASVGLIPVGATLSILVSDIPVSTSPLVTARKIYVSKAAGAFQYHGTVENNLVEIAEIPAVIDPVTLVEITPLVPAEPIEYEINSDPASVFTPPDENAIHMIDGDLFIEQNRVVFGTSLQNLLYMTNGVQSSGIPQYFAPINQEEIMVYPRPSADKVTSFFYFKLPAKIFGVVTSVPQMPSWLYEDLRNYVIWRGFAFRDRAGKESMKLNYEQGLGLSISRRGKPIKKSGRVRCTTPDSDGNGC